MPPLLPLAGCHQALVLPGLATTRRELLIGAELRAAPLPAKESWPRTTAGARADKNATAPLV